MNLHGTVTRSQTAIEMEWQDTSAAKAGAVARIDEKTGTPSLRSRHLENKD